MAYKQEGDDLKKKMSGVTAKGIRLKEFEVSSGSSSANTKKEHYIPSDEVIRKNQYKQEFYNKFKVSSNDFPDMFNREYNKSIEGSWRVGDEK